MRKKQSLRCLALQMLTWKARKKFRLRQKRPQSVSPQKGPAKKQKPTDNIPKALKEIANPGNGDCLFWALSHGLTAAGGKEKSPLQCRALAVAHLTKYQDSYARHWDGCFPCQGNKEIPTAIFLSISKSWLNKVLGAVL